MVRNAGVGLYGKEDRRPEWSQMEELSSEPRRMEGDQARMG